MVKDGAFSHGKDYVSIYLEILNLKEHLNRFICFKVTAILVNRGFYLVVELHGEGSASAACAVGLFHYNPIKMAHLSWTSLNLSLIREVCDRLGKMFLASLVGNHWATGGLQVNSSSVKGGLIIFPLFLLEENAILPMTPRADCALPIL